MRYRQRDGEQVTLLALIGINLVVFLGTYLFPELRLALGLTPALVRQEPWTLLTSMFVHAGIGHILVNMLTLYFFGRSLTDTVGEKRFLLVYFAGGILGGIFYILLANPFSTAVGASGAVFAVGGALTAMRPQMRVVIFPVPVPMPLWVAVLGGFALLTLLPGIAWQAHLGGMVFGLIAGYFFRRQERRGYRMWR